MGRIAGRWAAVFVRAAAGAGVILVSLVLSTEEASASELYFAYQGGASPSLRGDKFRNDFHITVTDAPRRVVFEDENGHPIDLPNEDEICEQTTSSRVVCRWGPMTHPVAFYNSEFGAGDTFDVGPKGCDDQRQIQLEFSNRAIGAKIWGTPLADDVFAGAGSVVYGCGGGDSLPSSSGKVIGGPGDDEFNGGSSINIGGSGDDYGSVGDGGIIKGGPGEDGISDRGGSSKLIGGPGSDGLASEGGHDILDGGSGNDILWAGSKSKVVDMAPLTYVLKETEGDVLRCGAGKDKARAGKKSKLSGCEKVEKLPQKSVVTARAASRHR